jgi:hypothetical protein
MVECKLEICHEPVWAIGYCAVHGKRYYKYGDPGEEGRKRRKRFDMPHPPARGFLWCGVCKCEKPLIDFDRSQDDGYRQVGRCKMCMSYAKQASKYGVSVEFLLDLEHKQNGCCAICGKPESKPWRLSLDHDHSCCPGKFSCGKCVRGLVCDAHNRMLGLANDQIEILESAIAYLKSFQS